MAGLMGRMLGAAKLDAATYEEVENDATATPQAMLVVVLASVAGGLGAMRAAGIVGLLLAVLASLLGWFGWAFVTFLLGTRVLPGAKTQAASSCGLLASPPRRA
jgi:CHASE2 domain-containing sensor protein